MKPVFPPCVSLFFSFDPRCAPFLPPLRVFPLCSARSPRRAISSLSLCQLAMPPGVVCLSPQPETPFLFFRELQRFFFLTKRRPPSRTSSHPVPPSGSGPIPSPFGEPPGVCFNQPIDVVSYASQKFLFSFTERRLPVSRQHLEISSVPSGRFQGWQYSHADYDDGMPNTFFTRACTRLFLGEDFGSYIPL